MVKLCVCLLNQFQHDQVGSFRAADEAGNAQPRVEPGFVKVAQTDQHAVLPEIWNADGHRDVGSKATLAVSFLQISHFR